MRLNKDQLVLTAKTFTDLAKILFGSAVIGFFIPGFSGAVTIPIFIIGGVVSASLFFLGVIILKSETL